jgi:hypothetical protein
MHASIPLVIGAPLIALGLCRCDAALAQTAPGQEPPACSAPSHRQFDFWVGEWDVANPAGVLVGRNRIDAAHGGCALIEHWTSVNGVTGTSLSIYDRDSGRWHQTWVDSGGGLLRLDGGIVGGAMVLTGDALDAGPPAKMSRQRVTWTRKPDGRVRQLWESSTDGGRTWNVVFDGWYSRAM